MRIILTGATGYVAEAPQVAHHQATLGEGKKRKQQFLNNMLK